MRRTSLLTAAVMILISGCDSQITGVASPLSPDQPLWSSGSADEYLVNTGAHVEDPGAMALIQGSADETQFDFVAGRFELTSTATTDAVEAFLWVSDGGDLNVVIRAEQDGLPGEAVASQKFSLETNEVSEWVVFEGYEATLSAGTYWLSFEPVLGSGLWGGMAPGAEHPLSGYAFSNTTSDGWAAMPSWSTDLGMRISGEASEGVEDEEEPEVAPIDVPEALTLLSETIASIDMNPGVRNSLEALVRNSLRKFEAGELEPGCGMLNALLNQIRAQSGKQVPTEAAQDLITQLESIQAQIGC